MKQQYVIFGASSGGEKVFWTLHSIGVEIAFFVDNNKNKWGQQLHNKLILSPTELVGKNVAIIIAAEEYQEQIEQQLEQMNLLHTIVLKEEIIIPFIIEHITDFTYPTTDTTIHKAQQIFIELLEGCPKGSGGIVSWSLMVAQLLQELGKNALIVSSARYGFPEGKETFFLPFETDYQTFWTSVKELVQYFSNHLPCVIFTNKQLQMFYAGIILKQIYPEQVKLYSVVHSDLNSLYRRAQCIEPYIDLFLCTTHTVKTKLSNYYGISKQKLSFHEMPISNAFFIPHILREQLEPIQLGWGGRLIKSLKRADLLIPFIHELEHLDIPYKFYIAGSGACSKEIEDYINTTSLKGSVFLLGQIKREDMPQFWSQIDIAIFLSEREGACLSLLEAMAGGAVPVSTDFNNAKDVIQSGINGYIVPQKDCKTMAQNIYKLAINRKLLYKMGTSATETIKKHYTQSDYSNYLLSILEK